MDKRITQTGNRQKPSNKLFGLVFTLTGALVFYFFVFPSLMYGYESDSWPKTEGTITHSEISTWMKEGNSQYDARINYSYTIDGKKYNSSKINVAGSYSGSSMSKAKKIVAEYSSGKTVDVFYDPEVPDSAVLKPGISGKDIALAAFTLLFFFSGLLVLLGIVKPQSTYNQNNMRGRTDVRKVFRNIRNQ